MHPAARAASMIICRINNDLVHIHSAQLMDFLGNDFGTFGESERVHSFLKAHPDKNFILENVGLTRLLRNAKPEDYGTSKGDIFCGKVTFDSKKRLVVCS
jgi:hypothetical protein